MSGAKGFGKRVAQERREKAARDCRDIGQNEVAKAIGAAGPTVSRWEGGLTMPGDRTIEKLAAYFGVTPAWLRYGQEPREAPARKEFTPTAKDAKPAKEGVGAKKKKQA